MISFEIKEKERGKKKVSQPFHCYSLLSHGVLSSYLIPFHQVSYRVYRFLGNDSRPKNVRMEVNLRAYDNNFRVSGEVNGKR